MTTKTKIGSILINFQKRPTVKFFVFSKKIGFIIDTQTGFRQLLHTGISLYGCSMHQLKNISRLQINSYFLLGSFRQLQILRTLAIGQFNFELFSATLLLRAGHSAAPQRQHNAHERSYTVASLAACWFKHGLNNVRQYKSGTTPT